MKTIYMNGHIITLEDITGNALVEENGKIIDVGDYQNLYKEDMKVIDLNGATLMPAFIDAHSHLSGYAMNYLQVALDDCQSIEDIQKTIRTYIQDNHQEEHQFINCKGYNQENLKQKQHITKQQLDSVSSTIPIVIQHYTGHCGVMNSAALHRLNITKDTESPQGGQINYNKGFLEENAYTFYVQRVPMPSLKELKKAYRQAQYQYASYGITTLQDGMIVDELKDIYQQLIDSNDFFLDVVGYSGFESHQFIQTFKNYKKVYHHHFKVGGYKTFLDGSPQNKTAWTINPYVDGTYGYPTLTDEQLHDYLLKAIQEDMQILVHCNGDQAIQHYINEYQKVYPQDIRPVIIHAQMMRPEQMKQAKDLDMIPSFFLAHVYYFGDIHRKNMGELRAQTISPLHSALKHNLLFTMHTDAPVIQPNMIETLHIAVNRQTQSGLTLGKEECIEPLDALKALTINAAYQYHEENHKGTLKVGKNADFVILSDNPLTIDKKSIKNIQVLMTIKDGHIIYEKE